MSYSNFERIRGFGKFNDEMIDFPLSMTILDV
jgi:hypothetical protein